MKIAVVYLNWKPAGIQPVKDFLDSYVTHPAGIEHDLIVHESSEGQDIAAYFDIAQSIHHTWVLFLNTYTQILCDDWLGKMAKKATGNIPLLGAFASWEKCPNGTTEFPNPHIRSNAFMIKKEWLFRYPWRPETKQGCYEFECGKESLTNWIQGFGFRPLLIVQTESLHIRDWNYANGFRLGNQEALIFSDRQSRYYDNASPEERARLTELAWGKS